MSRFLWAGCALTISVVSVTMIVATLATTPGQAIVVGRRAPCKKPSDRWRLVTASPKAKVFIRGRSYFVTDMKACLRGERTLYDLGPPTMPSVVRTRGRWVLHDEAGGEIGDDYYDFSLVDLRRALFRRFPLPGDLDFNEIKGLSLGAHGVFLYRQAFNDRERLILRGRTRRRRLGSGSAGTFSRLRVHGLRASWSEGCQRHTVRYRVVPKRLH